MNPPPSLSFFLWLVGESVGYVLGEYTAEFIGSTLVQNPSGNDTTSAAIER